MSTKPHYVLLESSDGRRWASLAHTAYVDSKRGTLEGTGQCMYDGRSIPQWVSNIYEVRDKEKTQVWSRDNG